MKERPAKQLTLLFSDLEQLVTDQTKPIPCEKNYILECVSEKKILIPDGSIFSEYQYTEKEEVIFDNPPNLRYRIDRVYLYQNTIGICLIYSSDLDSARCRITCRETKCKAIMLLDRKNLSVVYSSLREPSGYSDFEAGEFSIYWASENESYFTFSELQDSLSRILKPELQNYRTLRENYLEKDSLNSLMLN